MNEDEAIDRLCTEICALYSDLRKNMRDNFDIELTRKGEINPVDSLPDWMKSFTLKGHRSNIIDLRWSEKSKYLISTDSNNLIVLWKGSSGLIHNVVRNSNDQIVTATCLEDASVIFAGGSAAKLTVFNCQHRPESDGYSDYLTESCVDLPGGVTDIYYDNNSETIAIADDHKGVSLFKAETLQSIASCDYTSSMITRLKVLKNGNVLCGCSDGGCRLFDSRMGGKQLVTTFIGHSAQVQCLDIHPYLPGFISGSEDRTVNLFDLRANMPVKTYPFTSQRCAKIVRNLFETSKRSFQIQQQDENVFEVSDCCFTSTGRLFMSGTRSGSVLVWDVFDNTRPFLSSNLSGSVRRLQMNTNRDKMAVVFANTENIVEIYEPFHERR